MQLPDCLPDCLPEIVTAQHRAAFGVALLDWFAAHRRPLPWRQDYDPYHIWIAEMMLQQTQMERGVSYFLRWMEAFPTISDVAAAPEEAILRAWEGLGYYRRARYVQAAARLIIERHGGLFPRHIEAIKALPGIGPYTAAAIASTAFEVDIACVDGNVERVLARVFDIDTPVRQAPARGRIQTLADALLPPGSARAFNQAMMELGALVCRKKALCDACPLAAMCAARRLGIVDERPVPGRRGTVTHAVVVAGVLQREGRVFVQRRQLDDRVWAGLWEFPGGMVEAGETPEEAIVREFAEEVEFAVRIVRPLGVIQHNYTSYRLSLHCFALDLQSAAPCLPTPVLHEACAFTWATPEVLAGLPLPAAHRKLADACGLCAAPA